MKKIIILMACVGAFQVGQSAAAEEIDNALLHQKASKAIAAYTRISVGTFVERRCKLMSDQQANEFVKQLVGASSNLESTLKATGMTDEQARDTRLSIIGEAQKYSTTNYPSCDHQKARKVVERGSREVVCLNDYLSDKNNGSCFETDSDPRNI